MNLNKSITVFGFMLISTFIYAQKANKSLFPIGVVHIDSPDSVKVYREALTMEDDYLTWENYTGMPEQNTLLFWSQYGITCLKDSGEWYILLANPYYEMDINTGEPIKTDTVKKVYMKHSKHAVFYNWEEYFPGKYIYKYSGELYDDSLGKQVSTCKMQGCLIGRRVRGNWLLVSPPGNHDCSQFADPKCVKSFWVKWRDEKEVLVKLKPF